MESEATLHKGRAQIQNDASMALSAMRGTVSRIVLNLFKRIMQNDRQVNLLCNVVSSST